MKFQNNDSSCFSNVPIVAHCTLLHIYGRLQRIFCNVPFVRVFRIRRHIFRTFQYIISKRYLYFQSFFPIIVQLNDIYRHNLDRASYIETYPFLFRDGMHHNNVCIVPHKKTRRQSFFAFPFSMSILI